MQIQHPNLLMWLTRMAKVILYSGIELLTFFPIVLLTYLIISPVSILTWIILLLASYLLGAIIAMIGLRRAIVFYIFLLLATAMLVVLMTAGSIDWSSIIVWAISSYLGYRGAQMIVHEWSNIFTEQAFLIGHISYFLMSVGSLFASEWKPYTLALLWMGILSLVATFLVLNRQHLVAVAPKGFKMSSSVVSKNRLWTLLLLGIIFFISFIYLLNQILMGITYGMGYIVQLLYSWLSDLPLPEQPIQPSEILPFEEFEKKETIWTKILNILFTVISISILLLIVGWLCYKYLPLIGPAIRRLIQFIKKLIAKENTILVDAGYVDEKKQLMKWEDLRSTFRNSLRNRWSRWFQREQRWADLDNWRDRVRWLYKHRLMKAMSEGYVYRKDLSPREMLEVIDHQLKQNAPEIDGTLSLAKYYDKARYGGHAETVSDEQVNRLKEFTMKDKG